VCEIGNLFNFKLDRFPNWIGSRSYGHPSCERRGRVNFAEREQLGGAGDIFRGRLVLPRALRRDGCGLVQGYLAHKKKKRRTLQ